MLQVLEKRKVIKIDGKEVMGDSDMMIKLVKDVNDEVKVDGYSQFHRYFGH